MKKGILATCAAALLGLVGLTGCDQESSVKKETEIKGPDGTRTITQETKVEDSGTPPPVTAEPPTTP